MKMSENRTIHITMMKCGSVIYFFLEKEGLSYTWQHWERGLFCTHIRTMSNIGSYPPPPPPAPKHNRSLYRIVEKRRLRRACAKNADSPEYSLQALRRPSHGFCGTGGEGIYFRGTEEHRLNFEGNRGTKTILGNREHTKTNFRFWGNMGASQFISGEQGNRYPHPPPPPPSLRPPPPPPPWEGLIEHPV